MVSTKILLYKHKTLASGEHPVLIQVIYNRKRKNISLGFSAMERDWNPIKSRFKSKVENADIKNMALSRFDLLSRKLVDEAILSGKSFSITEFKRKLLGKQTTSTDFIAFCEELIQEMKTAGKVGNSAVYVNVKNSIHSFSGGVLNFEDINVTFLHKYEVWLSKDKSDRVGCAASTMNQYMRTISAVFNKAISRGIIAHELYPFRNQFNPKGYSYSHLKSEANHRALSTEELEKFKRFDLDKYPEFANEYYYFMFMYYCRGINWTDFCNLKHSDIQNGRIVYQRQKTGKKFSVNLSQNLLDIIEKFDSKIYLFPILSGFHKTPTQKANRIKKCIRQTNWGLKEIAMRLGIKPDISTYTARHTYAMSLKRGGINLNLISDAMGHADAKVTRHYLSSFGDELIDETDGVL